MYKEVHYIDINTYIVTQDSVRGFAIVVGGQMELNCVCVCLSVSKYDSFVAVNIYNPYKMDSFLLNHSVYLRSLCGTLENSNIVDCPMHSI
jgi:hypothetical protein